MPTRWYLPSTGVADVSPAQAAEWDITAGFDRLAMVRSRISSAMADKTTAKAASNQSNQDVLWRQYVSEPLDVQTISGTVKGRVRARENNAALNARMQVIIRVVSEDGATVRGTLYAGDLTTGTSNPTSEFAVSAVALAGTNRQAPRGASQSLASVNALLGDRIVIEYGWRIHTTGTVAYTASAIFGDDSGADLAEDESATGTNNPWIEFSATIVPKPPPPDPEPPEPEPQVRMPSIYPGRIVVGGRLYRCDINGVVIEDISREIIQGMVEWDADRLAAGSSSGTQFSASLTIRNPRRIAAYRDYLKPVLIVSYPSSGQVRRFPLGVFLTEIPDEDITRQHSIGTFQLNDLTMILRDKVFDAPYSIASGVNFRDAIVALIEGAGLMRHNIQVTDRSTGYVRTFKAGTTYLEALNRLCMAIGWYNVFMTPDGRISTLPFRDFSKIQPFATYTDNDPIGPLQLLPARANIGNVARVVRENPSQAPIVYTARNLDLESPISVPNVGREILIGGAPVRSSDIETEADAQALAEKMLRDAEGLYRVIKMRVLPGSPPAIYQSAELDMNLTTHNAYGRNLSGRYHIRRWQAGFTPVTAAVEMELAATRLANLTELAEE